MFTPRYIESVKNPRIPGFKWQDPENDGDRDMYRKILEQGCVSIAVPAESGTPDHSFSIGLYLNFLHPEILALGISDDVCNRAINRVREEAIEGKSLKIGDERTDLFELSYPVRFIEVDERYFFDYVGYAAWFYRSLLFGVEPIAKHKFPLLQAVWADKNGYYPDDPRCNEIARQAQMLYETP